MIVHNHRKYIGEKFHYYGCSKRFKLISVLDNGFVFYFNKNHCCTDSIFIDMIRCKTGQSIREEQQQTEINFTN